MAPSSHLWNGICAALVRPATERSINGMIIVHESALWAMAGMALMDSGTWMVCR